MCNALGHPPGCPCGFGPRHGRAGPAAARIDPAQFIRVPGRIVAERLWYATSCWWCRRPVFFFRNENGGCALFDESGAPWQVHECWRLHSEAQRRGAQAHYERQATQPRPPVHQAVPVDGETRVRVAGYVVRVQPEPVRFRRDPSTRTAAFASVHVCDKQNRLYHLLVPEPGARKIVKLDAVRAPAAWLPRAGSWHLFADTVRLEGGLDRLAVAIPGAPLALPALCAYCGDPVREDTEWGIDSGHRLECATCSGLRGRVSEEEFLLHCAERAALRTIRSTPLPGKLPGRYAPQQGAGPCIILEADQRWRREGELGAVGDFSCHDQTVRLYENGEIVYAFRINRTPGGTVLLEVHRERSRGRSGAPRLVLVRVTDQQAHRATHAAAKPPPPRQREKRATGRRAFQMLQRRFERLHGRYEAIVAHELELNQLFVLAGRRTNPTHWDRDAAEISRIQEELVQECRRLKSSCSHFRRMATALGVVAAGDESPLPRRFTVLEQNAARHPRPRGPLPPRPAQEPRPEPTPIVPDAPAPPVPTAASAAGAAPAPVAPARPRSASDFADKLLRALATPGEVIRTENR